MAHRGGARHPEVEGLENTRTAFAHAVALGYDYLETDVHATRDGVLLAFHDDRLDRVTDRRGRIADLTAAEARRARVGGREPVPTFDELLEAFPHARFNVDLKSAAAVRPLAETIAAHGAWERVLVGSFGPGRLAAFRRATHGRVATSASPPEVAAFVAPRTPGSVLRRLARSVRALQVPVAQRVPSDPRGVVVPVVTPRLVDRAHDVGVHVHVWTVDDPAEMRRLLDLGVDGLITDRTDVLRTVLEERGLWLPATAAAPPTGRTDRPTQEDPR
ncbi:glycerophosphodiester phosphodiesterase [Nocardioides sp. GY 10127]|nr:glycerophosphodiester phosphodiesterase [Nocardioides sp. GY 10127]